MTPRNSWDYLSDLFAPPGTPPADPSTPPRWADLWLGGCLVVIVGLALVAGGWLPW